MYRCSYHAGYPLPTLLRLARLIKAHIAPLDTILSYSNYDLQNPSFASFVPQFKAAGLVQVATASPFSMGLLTPRPPEWHPAPPALRDVVKQAAALTDDAGFAGGLPAVALGFALRQTVGLEEVPRVVGLSNLREVHETMRVWRGVNEGSELGKASKALEEQVRTLFASAGWAGWCWASPADA